MPDISGSILKQLMDFILNLKARLDVAEEALTNAGLDPTSLAQRQQDRLHELQALPKPAWLRRSAEKAENHDLEEFLRSLAKRQ